ncbi:50S ribosomal protein L4 [Synechococcus sp. RSCCF101]|uniref:50S ribosomal protein L4 n=1 Tax=Synechococcus sp. RSCCF101 TaxID=2511069 RepID=UPI0012443B6E|nr:50S ribosomal protein L4 [Synechococcus sp. RSCCF101]QEY32171.1 50S ribosomal protein L4 [Synechococcus sp. RSCCF101]
MAKCNVRDWQGQGSGTTDLDWPVAREESAGDLLQRAVVRQLANRRQGTAHTLTRSEVRGGGRKPYRQKGTGRARQGSIRTPLRPGGGIVFGPKPRDYTLAMNRKERRLALRTAVSSRCDQTTVVTGFGEGMDQPRTRDIVAALSRLGIEAGSKVLIILRQPSDTIRLSIRNLATVTLMEADQLNVFDLLHADHIVISQDAFQTIQEVYGDG